MQTWIGFHIMLLERMYGTVRYGTVRCVPVPGTGILSPDPDEALQDDVCPVTIRYISINGESLSKR